MKHRDVVELHQRASYRTEAIFRRRQGVRYVVYIMLECLKKTDQVTCRPTAPGHALGHSTADESKNVRSNIRHFYRYRHHGDDVGRRGWSAFHKRNNDKRCTADLDRSGGNDGGVEVMFHVKPLVIWSNDYHISPINNLKHLLRPFGVSFIDKGLGLSGHRHLPNTFGGRATLRMIGVNNAIHLSNPTLVGPIQWSLTTATPDESRTSGVVDEVRKRIRASLRRPCWNCSDLSTRVLSLALSYRRATNSASSEWHVKSNGTRNSNRTDRLKFGVRCRRQQPIRPGVLHRNQVFRIRWRYNDLNARTVDRSRTPFK